MILPINARSNTSTRGQNGNVILNATVEHREYTVLDTQLKQDIWALESGKSFSVILVFQDPSAEADTELQARVESPRQNPTICSMSTVCPQLPNFLAAFPRFVTKTSSAKAAHIDVSVHK